MSYSSTVVVHLIYTSRTTHKIKKTKMSAHDVYTDAWDFRSRIRALREDVWRNMFYIFGHLCMSFTISLSLSLSIARRLTVRAMYTRARVQYELDGASNACLIQSTQSQMKISSESLWFSCDLWSDTQNAATSCVSRPSLCCVLMIY